MLCTNAIPFCEQADELVLLRKGVIIERGTYASAMTGPVSELSRLLSEFGKSNDDSDSGIVGSGSGSEETVVEETLAAKVELDALDPVLLNRATQALMHRAVLIPVDVQKRQTLKALKASTRPKEKREQGSVKFGV